MNAPSVRAVRPPSNWRRRALVAGLVMLAAGIGIVKWPDYARWQARRALAHRDYRAAGRWIARSEYSPWSQPDSTLLKARWKRRQGLVSEVETLLAQAYQQGADRRAVEREQWLTFAQIGRMQVAEPHLTELLSDPGDDVLEICEAYASGYVFLRRHGDALRLLDAWLKDDPESAYAYLLRGRIRLDRRQWQRAEADFREVLKRLPRDTESRMALGQILQQGNRYDEAIAEFEQCVNVAETREAALIAQGTCWRMLGQNDKALDVFQRVLELNTQSHEALYELGKLERERGQSRSAAEHLRAAVAGLPASSDYRYALAQALQDLGEADQAKALLHDVEETLKLREKAQVLSDHAESHPRDIAVRLELGKVSLALDRPVEAVAWWTSVLDLEPRNSEAHTLLATYYRREAHRNPAFRERAAWHESQSAGRSKSTGS